MHHTGDRDAKLEEGRFLAEHIPGARFVEIQGVDHSWWTEDRDEIIDEIEEILTGNKPAREADRVLATVLFTDIVGSTQGVVDRGDRAWLELLKQHHVLVRKELARFRGREVNTIGDSFIAIFDGPARAIRCACNIRDSITQLGIEVRAGLHTGEIELLGDDIAGIAVHIGARVVAAAQPNEVLVSSTVRDLVAGSAIAFADRGVRVLKGVPGKRQLFAANPL
jgi:class 3 adenylate cyclase